MQNKMTKQELKEDFLMRIKEHKEGKQFEIQAIKYDSPLETIKHTIPSVYAAAKKVLR